MIEKDNTSKDSTSLDDSQLSDGGAERRKFLRKAGRFAAVTPPAVALMLSVPVTAKAGPVSGGGSAYSNSGRGDGSEYRNGVEVDPGGSGPRNRGGD